MRLLSLVGLAEEDNQLILVSDDGTKYAVPVDDKLTAAVTRDVERRAASPTDLGPMNGAPTPREIQERIRHGQSVESIAATADVSVESVERFAHQVLTERNYMATQARDTLVKIGSKQVELGAAVVDRLRGTGVDIDSIEWDAWRRTDGSWSVIASFTAGPNSRSMTFSYDATSKRVTPADDESRSILEAPPVAQPPKVVSSNPQHQQGPSSPQAQQQQKQKSAQPQQWDRAHPAARAQQRRESTQAAHPSTGAPTPNPTPTPVPTPQQNSAPTAPAPTEQTPRWEGLLFGTPTEDEGTQT